MKIVADENMPFAAECFGSVGRVRTIAGRAITAEVVRQADILAVRSITKVDEALLAGSRVKFVGTATIGVDHVDLAYLERAGIGFASAPGSNANSVAEYVVAAMLEVGRKRGIRLEGASIGIVGVGNVGSRVAAKARALGMEVVLNDPPLERATGDGNYRPLEEALGCDFVTLHTPLTREGPDATWHLADEGFFGRIRRGAVFINTSRGAVHDTPALKEAMASGRLGGVVLDVWEGEPVIDMDLLRKVDISTPHIAGYSYDGKVAGTAMIHEAACRHFGIEPTVRIADLLPAPPVPRVEVDTAGGDEQEAARRTVQAVYVINRDDFNTREIAAVPPGERGAFFDGLRKNYPVRREFHNTTAIVDDEAGRLADKLQGIGFKVGV